MVLLQFCKEQLQYTVAHSRMSMGKRLGMHYFCRILGTKKATHKG